MPGEARECPIKLIVKQALRFRACFVKHQAVRETEKIEMEALKSDAIILTIELSVEE